MQRLIQRLLTLIAFIFYIFVRGRLGLTAFRGAFRVVGNTRLDLGLGGSSESFSDYHVKDHRASAGLTAYRDFNFLKGFLDVSIGGTWQSSKVSGVTYRASDGLYAFGAGFEAPFTDRSALFGRIARNQYFDRDREAYWTYAAGANHWFTDKLGATFSVTFFESSSIIYALGVNVRF